VPIADVQDQRRKQHVVEQQRRGRSIRRLLINTFLIQNDIHRKRIKNRKVIAGWKFLLLWNENSVREKIESRGGWEVYLFLLLMIVGIQSRLFYFSLALFSFLSRPPQQISIINTHTHTHIHTGYEFKNSEWREKKKEKGKCRCCERGIWISHVILELGLFPIPSVFSLTIKLRCTGDDKTLFSQPCEWWHLNAQP
jgi:hypothetical protein